MTATTKTKSVTKATAKTNAMIIALVSETIARDFYVREGVTAKGKAYSIVKLNRGIQYKYTDQKHPNGDKIIARNDRGYHDVDERPLDEAKALLSVLDTAPEFRALRHELEVHEGKRGDGSEYCIIRPRIYANSEPFKALGCFVLTRG